MTSTGISLDNGTAGERLGPLIRAAQGGSQAAWAALFDRCIGHIQRQVRCLAGRRLLTCENVDDLVGWVLGELTIGLPRLEYRGDGAFMAWISRIVRSTVAARAKHHNAKKRPPRPLPLTVVGPESTLTVSWPHRQPSSPLMAAALHDECDVIRSCALSLGVEHRTLVGLYLKHGNDMHAIGRALGISPDAARMRWLRVRRKLKGLAISLGLEAAA